MDISSSPRPPHRPALDDASTRIVIDALKGHAAQGGCVLVATHDPRVIESADRIVPIDNGIID